MSSSPNLDALSQFEWLIMNFLWDMEKASARKVMESMPEEGQRAYTTIQTYMERLVDKGYLSKEKIGMVNFYTTEIARESAVDGATSNFIDKVFQGSGSSLAAYLLKNNRLNQDDLEKIKDILEGEA
ncbi:MAG: BlaI/MecI/CopY family transcriptional regulator [Candidatus Marinimicrobia bacterium]|jgi:predicted transcriptional regulator|nr:BlaI/MecI/CopY family transcriptional regulator [Candidatus Neomarinimicrobiota bacterium]MBT3576460.1 BlaI/MecI/CopY family transcriptional regulator [Candidatus Neomarinimicrobiota bacterium]MBT3680909.1 BlaI/MecI/CopY family transcriptional regulator [Candidatus Neomarinimicrobiota bacterium]MBT3949525.1 BlaI/MecI/CopY family transcriptional regulator [Candidatus Neomarinimicrobiota bacterium]MBT4253738.1 BlaI/MecI/CopY family transcriptional regulator [Candidatus Neomarinimicrobiota bact